MGVEDAIAFYEACPQDKQIRLLALFAHELTIRSRDTYEVGTDNVLHPTYLRRFNEVQHRVLGHLLKLLDNDDRRYPDDVMVRIMLSDAGPELQPHLEADFWRVAKRSR